jgi:transcription antitermination factor NusG
MNKYLILFHLTELEQTDEEWEVFIKLLNSTGQLCGGSALAKPIGIKNGRQINALSKSVGGYMIIKANSQDEVCELIKSSPSHIKDGLVEIFHLI